MLFNQDQSRLQEKCKAVRRLIQVEGFGAPIEMLNATDAFLGSQPGVFYANIREPLNTRNLADLIPSTRSGRETRSRRAHSIPHGRRY